MARGNSLKIESREGRQVNPNSLYNRLKRFLEGAYGPYTRDGEEWEDLEIHHLVQHVDEGMKFAVPNIPCLHTVGRRSLKSVNTILWKVPIGYRKLKENTLECFADRQEKDFNLLDRGFLEAALSEKAKEYLKDPVGHAATLLGRTRPQMAKWIRRLAKEQEGRRAGLKFPDQETEEERLWRLARQRLKGSLEALKNSLGPIRVTLATMQQLRDKGILMPEELNFQGFLTGRNSTGLIRMMKQQLPKNTLPIELIEE